LFQAQEIDTLNHRLAAANETVRELEKVKEKEAAMKVHQNLSISLSDPIQIQADEEIATLKAQVSSLLTQPDEKKKSAVASDLPLLDCSPSHEAIEQLKGFVIERFKHHINVQRAAELNEKIKNDTSRDKKLLSVWKTELKALTSLPPSSDAASLDRIQLLAQELIHKFEEYEDQLLDDVGLEASMLCEVKRLNLLNFLRVFEVEVNFDHRAPSHPHPSAASTYPTGLRSDQNTNTNDEEMLKLQKQISLLEEKNVCLQYELIHKERAVKDFETTIARSQRKDGIGLEVKFTVLPSSSVI
jgi:hypothetical protein